MERIRDVKCRIADVKKLIEINGEVEYNSFMKDLEVNGTPLEEEFDENYNLITFLYESNFECKNVLLILPITPDDYRSNLMERINGTNLWYSIYKIRNDSQFGYYFSPNDSLEKNCMNRHNNLENDVFNSQFTIIKPKSGNQDRMRSNCVLNKFKQNEITLADCFEEKGKIVEYYFDSKILNEKRRVRIYLPFGYENYNDDFNFLLLTDGEEHLSHLTANIILDNLIYQKKIPKMISILIDLVLCQENG